MTLQIWTIVKRLGKPTWAQLQALPQVKAKLGPVAPMLLISCAILLWYASLRGVDIRQIGGWGLISLLPITTWIAFLLVTLGFCLLVNQRARSTALMAISTMAMLVMLYATPSLIEEQPRWGSTWKMVGVTDYVIRHGSVDRGIDAFFNWPGFFVFAAFATWAGGATTPLSITPWVPVLLNLLYMGPLLMIMSSATDDKRHVWLGLWFFYLLNWVGQDYYSPQGFAYFHYLVIIAILLTWVQAGGADIPRWLRGVFTIPAVSRLRSALSRREARVYVPSHGIHPKQRMVLLAIVICIYGLIVSSHQLTPLAILLGVTFLVIFGRLRARFLPVVMAVIFGTWLIYAAMPFLSGHLREIVSEIGRIGTVTDANIADRLHGSPGHMLVLRARLGVTALFWILSLLGAIKRVRAGWLDVSMGLLAITPFVLLMVQSYGGEMILRVYFYSLPFMCFFFSSLFAHEGSTLESRGMGLTLFVISLLLVACIFVTRYGDEKAHYYSTQEFRAVEYLYDAAPPGSLLLSAVHNLPWRFRDYVTYDYEPIAEDAPYKKSELTGKGTDEPNADRIIQRMRAAEETYPGVYLILTRSQKNYAEWFGVLPDGLFDRLGSALVQSAEVKVIFSNDDAKILTLTSTPKRMKVGE